MLGSWDEHEARQLRAPTSASALSLARYADTGRIQRLGRLSFRPMTWRRRWRSATANGWPSARSAARFNCHRRHPNCSMPSPPPTDPFALMGVGRGRREADSLNADAPSPVARELYGRLQKRVEAGDYADALDELQRGDFTSPLLSELFDDVVFDVGQRALNRQSPRLWGLLNVLGLQPEFSPVVVAVSRVLHLWPQGRVHIVLVGDSVRFACGLVAPVDRCYQAMRGAWEQAEDSVHQRESRRCSACAAHAPSYPECEERSSPLGHFYGELIELTVEHCELAARRAVLAVVAGELPSQDLADEVAHQFTERVTQMAVQLACGSGESALRFGLGDSWRELTALLKVEPQTPLAGHVLAEDWGELAERFHAFWTNERPIYRLSPELRLARFWETRLRPRMNCHADFDL
jgi:hypothetical protein